MAHISGVFSKSFAGRLQITIAGTFYQGIGRDAGFPTGDSNMLVRPKVGGYYGPAIDRFAPIATFELDYPGGNVPWAVESETLATSTSGVATYGFSNLIITCRLTKK